MAISAFQKEVSKRQETIRRIARVVRPGGGEAEALSLLHNDKVQESVQKHWRLVHHADTSSAIKQEVLNAAVALGVIMERDRVHWFFQLADLEEEADAEEPSGTALCATGGADSDSGVPLDRTTQVKFDMTVFQGCVLTLIYLCIVCIHTFVCVWVWTIDELCRQVAIGLRWFRPSHFPSCKKHWSNISSAPATRCGCIS